MGMFLFLMVKGVNALRTQVERKDDKIAEAAPPPADVQLLTEIRDLLAKR